MDPVLGKTANPPTVIQNLNIDSNLSALNSIEFPSLPTVNNQNTLYKQGIYPSLINKATLGKQNKILTDQTVKTTKPYSNLINPTIKYTYDQQNTDLNFGLGQQHIDVLNKFKIYNEDSRLTPKNELSGSNYFTQDNTGIYGTSEALKERNSNIYKCDNIIGKPIFTQDYSTIKSKSGVGEPILIKKNNFHNLPQVKYGQYDVPVFKVSADFTDRDEQITQIAKDDWTRNKHIPYESETTDFIKPIGKFISDEPNTLNYVIQKSQQIRPELSINNESFTSKQNIDLSSVKEFISDFFKSKSTRQHVEHIEQFKQFNSMSKKQSLTQKTKKIFDDSVKNIISTIKSHHINTSQHNIFQQSETFINAEHFENKSLNDSDELYQELLRSYAIALCYYLNHSKKYSKWSYNWKILDDNLKKTNLLVKRLNSDDKDVAYTQNKGEIIKFRWRDMESYIPRSVFAYVLMHELTHQVFPMTFQGHGDPFPDMLSIICVAGYELRIFDLKNIPKKTVYSNGQEITSRDSLTHELLQGIKFLRKANPNSKAYYDQLEEVIKLDNRS